MGITTMRCPKHDVLFDAATDPRYPGAGADEHHAAHPHDCHPDCPKPGPGDEVPPIEEVPPVVE
jgi:hypothetical protein